MPEAKASWDVAAAAWEAANTALRWREKLLRGGDGIEDVGDGADEEHEHGTVADAGLGHDGKHAQGPGQEGPAAIGRRTGARTGV
jgi:hypothetical protein